MYLRASDSSVRRRPKPPDAVHIQSEYTHTLKGVGLPPSTVARSRAGSTEECSASGPSTGIVHIKSKCPVTLKGVGFGPTQAARNHLTSFTLLPMGGLNLRPSNWRRFGADCHPRNDVARTSATATGPDGRRRYSSRRCRTGGGRPVIPHVVRSVGPDDARAVRLVGLGPVKGWSFSCARSVCAKNYSMDSTRVHKKHRGSFAGRLTRLSVRCPAWRRSPP